MVKHKGLCPSLKRSVEFDVNEVIELKTKRGTKYQVKGDYEGRTCSTFCSKAKAMELKSALGQTTMSAESEDMLGQAHQDESVSPMDNNVQPLAEGQEPMTDMPVQETVATPITGTSVGVEAIDNLQLNDADALANMATQFDDAPDMVADFEIAPQEPEGDGRSIGNIRPMNEDVPLHAESEDGTGQAHQEEGVSPIETDVQPLAEGQEPMGNMPVQETVATPITNSSVGVEAIDNLQLNDADALANMATQFDEAPEMLANFEISFMQPFGDGQSIGNNTPMNPDVPLHAETFESPIQTVNPMDETTLTTPPPVCFVEKIPPVVWENMSVLEQIEYAETGNESLLSCPQCGITKADLRGAGGYCAVSDPEGGEYISSVDCPYQKHFAPSHWLDAGYVVGHVEGDIVEVSERLPAKVDMPKMKNPQKGLETMVVPYFVWDKIYSQFNGGITAESDLSGLNYTLQFHGMMKPQIKNLIEVAEGEHDIMFGSETYTATVLKAEKDRGYFIDSATVRPYGAETFEADMNKPANMRKYFMDELGFENVEELEAYFEEMDAEREKLERMNKDEIMEQLYELVRPNEEDYQQYLQMNKEELIEVYMEYYDDTYYAETFGVEFDDWADQEMLTHGKTVSFKEWAKEEGKKHGDMDLTDWAEEEEESHDERYGAEEFLPNGVLRYYGKTIKEGQKGMFKGAEVKIIKITEVKTHGMPSVIIYEYLDDEGNPLEIKGMFGMKTRDSTTVKDFMINFTPFEPVNPIEYGAEDDVKEYHMVLNYGSMKPMKKVLEWYSDEFSMDEIIEEFRELALNPDLDKDYNQLQDVFLIDADDDEVKYAYSYVFNQFYKDGVDEVNAETFNAELEDCYVCDGMFKQVYVCDNDCGFQCCEIDIDGNLIPVENADGTVKDYCITCYEEKYGAETFESPTQLSQRPHIYQHNGVQYQIKRNSYKPTGKDLMADIDFTNDRGEWIETIETDYHANMDEVHNDAQRIIDEYKDKSDKPSLKSVGLLLGVGALATYFAPKSMRDFLNRLK